jgi:hypothetical protein
VKLTVSINQRKEFCMLQKRLFGMPTLIVGVMLVFSLMGCDNGTTGGPDPKPPAPQSISYVSKDNSGNLYTLEITEDTSGTTRYAVKQGDFFKLTVELYNDGVYSVALTYSGTVESAEGNGTEIAISVTVNGKPLAITINGTAMTVISGEIVNNQGEAVVETPETLTPVVDKRALQTAINAANTAKQGVVVSANGADVLTTVYWVSQPRMDTFTTAITTALAVYDNAQADQSMVDYAKIVIETATAAFTGYKQLGTKTEPQETDYDVYVVGTVYTEESATATVWKNGQMTTLPSTGYVWIQDVIVSGSDVYVLGNDCYWKNSVRVPLVPLSGNVSSARAMAISGSDVYVVGNTLNDNDDWLACYWKNGNLTTLTTHRGSEATSIFISGGDVYIAGYDEYDSFVDDYWSVSVQKACYWKNGNRILLTDGSSLASAEVITISDGEIYVLGSIATWDSAAQKGTRVPCYWKGNTRTDLPVDSTYWFSMDAMIVSNSNVYVLGREQQSDEGRHPAYWKNGVKMPLNGMDDYGDGANHRTQMAVSGTDVYVAGDSMGVACYWKNGNKITLSAQESSASSIAVSGSDVYVAGRVSSAFTDSPSVACYWKNGTLIELSSNASYASARGIVVVAKN